MRQKSILVAGMAVILLAAIPTVTQAALIASWSFDEQSGTTAFDSAGDNDGIVHGAEWVDGIIDGALNFDGVADYVEVASADELNLNSSGTISAWIYPRSLYEQSIVNKRGGPGDGNKSENYWLVLGMYNRAVTVGDGSDYVYASIPEGELAVNTWQHIAGTWDSSEIKIYLNGILSDARPNTLSDLISGDSYPLRIGYDSRAYWHFDGLIDEVRIYDVALSDAEIRELAVPEPGTLLFFVLGGLATCRRLRQP
ncbi:MAG: hypothetical protein JXN61_09120 [Sedimentisphaerales bacterium]|nr:hypothetical protein [Sedimentisphaerales bacterium]